MATVTVTSTADSGAGSLRQAISDAAAGDTIEFDSTTFPEGVGTTIYLSSQLAPTKTLIIDGGATWTSGGVLKTRVILDAQDERRVMQNASYNLAFNGITFANGYVTSTSYGGGYRGENSSAAAFNNCVFDHCRAARNGGGVYLHSSASGTFTNCLFDTCHGPTSATYNGGCAYIVDSSSATFTNCTFDTCYIRGYGGTINFNSSGVLTVSDCTFSGCYATVESGGCFFFSSSGTKTITNCVFNSCSAPNGSVAIIASTGDVTFNRCLFANNTATSRGCIADFSAASAAATVVENCVAYGNSSGSGSCSVVDYSISVGSVTVKGCTFGQSGAGLDEVSTTNATITDSLLAQNVDFSTVGFIDLANHDFRLAPGSAYLSGATGYQSGDVDFLGHPRKDNGALGAYEGSWVVVDDNGTLTLSGDLITDYLIIGDGATITFSGVDRILAVTSGATIGGATFQNGTDSTGYLAIPVGTVLTDATFTGVKSATYGAGASGFSAAIASATTATLSWSATNANVPVLLEIQNGGAWNTLSASATSPYTATADPIGGQTFRLFDGVNFLTATSVSELAKLYQVVAGTITVDADENDWRAVTLVKTRWQVVSGTIPLNSDGNNWQVITYLVSVTDMDQNVKPGQALSLLARVYDAYDNNSPLLNDGSNISSVYYTCEKKTKGILDPEWSPVTGHNNVSVDPSCVLSQLTEDDAWDVDQIGYNFALTPDIRTNPLFDDAGEYRIRVRVNLSSGNPVVFYKTVNVVN